MVGSKMVFALLMLAVLGGCYYPLTPSKKVVLCPPPYTIDGIRIEIFEDTDSIFGMGMLTMSFKGTATNRSGNDLKNIKIFFDVVDMEGTKIADAIAGTRSLKNGEKWQFTAILNPPKNYPFIEIRHVDLEYEEWGK